MNHHDEGIPDPEKIKEILNIVSDQVPGLLKELAGVLYGPDQAKKFGVAVAIFYKELKAAGMTDEQAFELTRQYMSTLNIGGMFSQMAGHNHGSGSVKKGMASDEEK
jgi:hypothetical protein